MYKIKRSMSAIIVIILVLTTILTGCGSKDKPTPESKGNDITNPYAKHLEISWIGHYQGYAPVLGTDVQKEIEKRFNVTIKPVEINYSNAEQWNLYWASGNSADHITSTNQGRYFNMINDGLVREISEDMIRKNIPTWMKKVESIIDPEIVKKQMKFEGKVYGIPFVKYSNTTQWITGVRKDWMDKVGISKNPTTLDELHDLMVKFTRYDPDGNGVDDTYAMTPSGNNNGAQLILAAYGVQRDSYYEKNGKVYATSTAEEYKQALKTLSKWSQEGLFEPKAVTDKRDEHRKKWAGGTIGLLSDNPWWFAKSTTNNLTDMVISQNSNAKISFLESVKGPNGKSGGFVVYPSIFNWMIMFGSQTSDEKVQRIMDIKEYMSKDWDFYVRCYYGVEGQHYSKDKDGVISFLPEFLDVKKQVELGLTSYFALIPDDLEHFKKINPVSDYEVYNASSKIPKSYSGVAFAYDGENESSKDKVAEVNKVANDFFNRAIAGKVDVDLEWNDYVSRINSVGLTDIVKEYQTLYDKANK